MVIFSPFSTPLPHPLFFNLSSTPFQQPFSPPSVDIFYHSLLHLFTSV